MPKSKKRADAKYTGNTFLLTSKEAKELRGAIGVLAGQLGQLMSLLMNVNERLGKLEDPTAIKIASPADVAGIIT